VVRTKAVSRCAGHVTQAQERFLAGFTGNRLDLPGHSLNITTVAALFSINSELRYEIVRKIFEGGMGIIYEAEQHGARNFIKRVAIKVIRQSYASRT
jgi:hypothetical protein